MGINSAGPAGLESKLPGVGNAELTRGSDTWVLNLMWSVPRLRRLVRWLAPDFTYVRKEKVDYGKPLSAEERKRQARLKLDQKEIANEFSNDPFADEELARKLRGD